MDINSLLSPSETSQSKPTTPVPVASPAGGQMHRVGSGLLKQAGNSLPFAKTATPPSSLPQHILSPMRKGPLKSPTRSPTAGAHNASPPVDLQSSRSSSTQNMDALADLASMQNHQPSKGAPPGLQSRGSFESQLSPSTLFPTVQPVAATSNPRTAFDVGVVDGQRKTSRTEFGGTSLPLELQQQAKMFAEYLVQNPYAYDWHAGLIRLLHKGFRDHVYPPDAPNAHGDPHTYDLLEELRSARETMDKLFAIGEDLWSDWIQDDSMLARTIDERIGVMEKCSKAVQEEFGSTKLWLTYGEWVLYCYNSVQENSQLPESNSFTLEEKLVGREVFTWQLVLDVWKEGAENTKWRINDSHLVWNRYIDLLIQEAKRTNSLEMIKAIRGLFEERLQIPHTSWEETSQLYSTFITAYFESSYEEIMVATNRLASEAKARANDREVMEFALQKAQTSGDQTLEYNTFIEYLQWEETQQKRKLSNFDLHNALYERAELRFPSDSNIWEQHSVYMIDEAYHGRTNQSSLLMLDRATRHCPWSGSLWSQYLLSSEREGQSFPQTEEIKHKATNTGLLDVGGIEEVLKVHVAWCSYLRRRAFRPEANDEDLDVAEMGIRSSIENLQELANKTKGEGSVPDPLFRLERIYIKYLTQSGSWDSAREAFRGLIPKHGHSWEFWMRFYVWEMIRWARFIHGDQSTSDEVAQTTSPHYAAAVLLEALEVENLDIPEKIIGLLILHCEDNEDVDELQLAIIKTKRLGKKLAKRRALEAAERNAKISAGETYQQEAVDLEIHGHHAGKRKRDGEEFVDEPNKKSKSSEVGPSSLAAEHSVEQEVKRDRENASILVQNMPEGTTETRARQFFRDCGTVTSLKLLQGGTSAVIEFDEKEAALYAQMRDGKDMDGMTIQVQLGTGSTLYVTNFPPTADEATIRELFGKFGEIVDIRFPSLKFNTRRRFCYVQFKLNSQAQTATELDGHDFEGFILVVKLSDPEHKQNRSGALEEGREVYIRNIDWHAGEKDIEALFSQYGTVQSVRIPRRLDGKSKGFGYVVFSSPDDAKAALALHEKDFKSRKLHVEIASKGGAKRQATAKGSDLASVRSASVEANGAAASPSAMSISSAGETSQPVGNRASRTFALLNVPDTVNVNRIEALAGEYGPLVKVVLRPDHQGAIVEYLHENDAGKAMLNFEGFEIAPERHLRVGSVPEMLKEKAEVKVDRIQTGQGKKPNGNASTSTNLQSSGPIKRPAQHSGRRGGLGQRRGLGFNVSSRKDEDKDKVNGDSSGGGVGSKSNDDFRAMLGKK